MIKVIVFPVPNDGIDVKTGTVENCYILPKLSHTPGGIKSQTSNANKEVTLGMSCDHFVLIL